MCANNHKTKSIHLFLMLACVSGLGAGTYSRQQNIPSESLLTNKPNLAAITAEEAIRQALEISTREISIPASNIPNTSIGVNDFRISEAGLVDVWGSALYPDVAYNDNDEEYLVVWWGCESHSTPGSPRI